MRLRSLREDDRIWGPTQLHMAIQLSLSQAQAVQLYDILTSHKKQLNNLLEQRIDKLIDSDAKGGFDESDANLIYSYGKMAAKAEALKELLDESGVDISKSVFKDDWLEVATADLQQVWDQGLASRNVQPHAVPRTVHPKTWQA